MLIKSMILSIPTYYMSLFKVYGTAIVKRERLH